MEFWNSTLTEKSWKLLQELKGFRYIVIGGWAAYLWTNLHKSKDIDIVLENFEDLAFLKTKYDLSKNNNLKKYEIKIEEIEIDVYVPFFSTLAVPVDEIHKHTAKIQNFKVVKPAILLILKQGAEQDREQSVKGQKDRIDIMTLLLNANIDFKEYFNLLKKYNKEYLYERLKNIISNFREIKYLNVNPGKFKLKKQEIMKKLKKR